MFRYLPPCLLGVECCRAKNKIINYLMKCICFVRDKRHLEFHVRPWSLYINLYLYIYSLIPTFSLCTLNTIILSKPTFILPCLLLFASMGDNNVNLPPGFRFYPTDEELVVHFLHRKASLLPCHPDVIPDLEVYPYDPWELDGTTPCFGFNFHYTPLCSMPAILNC